MHLIKTRHHATQFAKRSGGALCICLLALVVSACSSTQAQVPDLATTPSLANATISAPATQHKLGSGEKVRVTIFGEPQLSGEFDVDATGNLALPLIGQVAVTGQTTKDVEAAITQKLKGRYLVDPKVNVEVASYRKIYVIGEVKTSGEYPYTPGLNVMSAVALAGGFTPRASPSYVYIKRANETTEQEMATSAEIPVQPGDLIRIPERYF